ncbi:MAG: phasin family protein, partial [Pseudomonadota bacterium]|nr:phasin family protein [Pseudomonadota bacterium]
MSDDNVQFVNQAQQASHLAYETIHGVAETQFTIAQRLGEIQQSFFSQAIEAAYDQLQLISRVKEPREYAS